VPGDPSKLFEHPELAAAAKTWSSAENCGDVARIRFANSSNVAGIL
jgi:hypothetical protein